MDGIINIYKERDYTSHDVVARLRGILHTRKIGHTGTLDPMAEGVLPVCVGNATKLCEAFTDHDKEYEAVMLLGKTYDTLDVTGSLLEERKVMSAKDEIEEAVMSFIGGYDQVPPMYSAKKVDGVRLYELARSGVTVERKPVPVKIYDIKILSVDIPHVRIKVECSKGTYIRSLIDDIGKKLGCGAAMEELTRTRVGRFEIGKSYRLSEIEEAVRSGEIADLMLSVEAVFDDLKGVELSQELSKLLRNGNVIPGKEIRKITGDQKPAEPEKIRMYDSDKSFIGVYEYKISGDIYKPYKMFL